LNDGICSVTPGRDAPTYVARHHHPVKSGTHRVEGMLIARGPGIKVGRVEGARIQDIAPTLLHLLGASADPGMDGRVLLEALDTEHTGAGRTLWGPSGESLFIPTPARPSVHHGR